MLQGVRQSFSFAPGGMTPESKQNSPFGSSVLSNPSVYNNQPNMNQSSSISAATKPSGPKFNSLQAAEMILDDKQAESLRRLRLVHRNAHPLLLNPKDYLYRWIFGGVILKSFARQFIQTVFFLSVWLLLADIVGTVFFHVYFHTESTLFGDLINLWDWRRYAGSLRVLFGAAVLSLCSSWYFIETMFMPPPLLESRHWKFCKVLGRMFPRGPWVGIFMAVVVLRPTAGLLKATPLETSASSSVVHFWGLVFELVTPVLLCFLVISTEIFSLIWRGDFYVGGLRGPPPAVGPTINMALVLRKLNVFLSGIVRFMLRPVMERPGVLFWFITGVLFIAPLIFQMSAVAHLWIRYHFLIFAVVRTWKLNTLTFRECFCAPHRFSRLEFLDLLDVVPLLQEFRKVKFQWTGYLELQLVAYVVERFKRDPNFLKEFLAVRHPVKTMIKLEHLIDFWLEPLRHFQIEATKPTFLGQTSIEPSGRIWRLLPWVLDQLLYVHAVYDDILIDHVEEYLPRHSSQIVAGSFTAAVHSNLLVHFVTKSKGLDVFGILWPQHKLIAEEMAQLMQQLRDLERNGRGLMNDSVTVYSTPRMEAGARFHVKWYRQLLHYSEIYLKDAVKVIGKPLSEYQFASQANDSASMTLFFDGLVSEKPKEDSDTDL